MLPKSLKGTFSFDRIKNLKDKDIDKFYEYHKRISILRSLIQRYPNKKIKYAQEIMLCQEEQKKMIKESRTKEGIKK